MRYEAFGLGLLTPLCKCMSTYVLLGTGDAKKTTKARKELAEKDAETLKEVSRSAKRGNLANCSNARFVISSLHVLQSTPE